jgi:hypothetical protein
MVDFIAAPYPQNEQNAVVAFSEEVQVLQLLVTSDCTSVAREEEQIPVIG